MASTLTTPEDLLHLQLRTALTMEDHSLTALGELESAAASRDVKKMFRHHADETREQIENLHRVFAVLDLRDSTSPSPSTTGIRRQAESLIARTAEGLRDQVVLSCALGNEHYEVAAYEGLIVPLEARGATDAAALLRANLDQEEHTAEELRGMLTQIVA